MGGPLNTRRRGDLQTQIDALQPFLSSAGLSYEQFKGLVAQSGGRSSMSSGECCRTRCRGLLADRIDAAGVTTTDHAENIVVGGGEAGKYIAWELAREGRPTVVIERGLIGGSCPNIACLPSKNVIRSAQVAEFVRRASEYGTRSTRATTHMPDVRERKREMVDGMIDIHRKRFDVPGIEFVIGEARVVGPRTIDIHLPDASVRRITGDRVFLNLGTRPSIPGIPGIAASEPLTHIEALELAHLPEHLIVLGGGYVGVEFAQAFRRLGSAVTLVQQNDQLMPREDHDVADAVHEIFKQDGIDVVLGAETYAVEGRSGDRVLLRLRTPTGELVIEGTDLLVATGRTPNTDRLGLDVAGIDVDERGFVKVDDRLRTSAAEVWALGECAGSPQFTHVAFDDFRVVRDNLAGTDRSTRDRLVPYCAFIDPQLGRVGLNEKDAQRANVHFRVARLR